MSELSQLVPTLNICDDYLKTDELEGGYNVPGPIDNKSICLDGFTKVLKRNLIANLDYISVPAAIWR